MKMSSGLALSLAACLMLPAAAMADVKTGVDAWTQGDYDGAIAEWRPLAIAGDPDAQFNMGQAYKLGRGVPADLTIALDWFQKAQAQGHVRAADNYGLLLFQQGRREEAMPFIRASSDRAEPRAQYIYATALFNGDLVPQDWVQSYALMTKAAQAGLAPATESLKEMDQYVPEDQRRRGLALAATLNGATMAQAPTTQTEKPKPAAIPVKTAAAAGAAAKPIQTVPVPPAVKPLDPPAPAKAPPVQTASTLITPPAGQLLADKAHDPFDTGAGSRPLTAPADRAPRPSPKPAAAAPAPTPAATAKAAPGGRWRVQLGAFGDAGRARSLWQSLSGKVADLGALQPFFVDGGGVTRLQAGPLATQADAARVCARVKASGGDCLPKAS